MIELIVEQHAEDAAFLWRRRDEASRAPHYDLADLCAIDERVEAHLDGLRVAGDLGWEICEAALDEEDAGAIFTAAVLAVERGDVPGIARVLDGGGAVPVPSPGFMSALGWVAFDNVARILPGLLDPLCPASLRHLGIAACAAHRRDPGAALTQALFDADLRLRARALRAVGELGRTDLLRDILEELGSADEGCRFAAAWSAALLGDPAAVEVLRAIASAGGERSERACSLAVRRLDPKDGADFLDFLGKRSELPRAAIVGAGALGDPSLAPWLIQCMDTPALARIAGESWSTITGIEIVGALAGGPPEGFSAGPTDDPADEDVAMDPDEKLTWPNAAAVRRLWTTRGPAFRPGVRYLLGSPMTPEWLQRVLGEAGQRRRAAAAMEITIRTPGTALFEVRAPGPRQRGALMAG
jgi:uncharacterized protein (TIGR02270 family)